MSEQTAAQAATGETAQDDMDDMDGVRLYIGGHAHTIQGEPFDLGGQRCFTAVHPPPAHTDTSDLAYLLDSGAFSDAPKYRLTPDQALDRQLAWESKAADLWGAPIAAEAVVSYDLLIDEVWTGGVRHKRRWSVDDAEAAVCETVTAAAYLASRRRELQPRRLVLSCQGVDAVQYAECTAAVLSYAEPDDWIGLGGWCIVGRFTSWMPEFRRTMARESWLAGNAPEIDPETVETIWRSLVGERLVPFGVVYPLPGELPIPAWQRDELSERRDRQRAKATQRATPRKKKRGVHA